MGRDLDRGRHRDMASLDAFSMPIVQGAFLSCIPEVLEVRISKYLFEQVRRVWLRFVQVEET